MKTKVWDVQPATNFMQRFVAESNYALVGLTIRRTKIPVTFIEDNTPLGTEDGQSYTVYPSLPDDDEEGLHGRNAK